MLRRLIGEDIELSWLPGAGIGAVLMDPAQIDQVLANLCVNARDAITDVGTIAIETADAHVDEAWSSQHRDAIPGDYVLLTVSDTGSGMDQQTLSAIFEPFFTTKEMGKGTGLGLATVYGIVKQNDGFITVSSEPGRGTQFCVYLPRCGGRTETPPDTPASTGPAAQGAETILLVEDEPAIQQMAKAMLERLGYTVLTTTSPTEAIRLADAHAGDIDLLMTDVIMPEMNGRDLATDLLALYPDIKCLFMSGYAADVIAPHGVLEPGVHFVQKPFSVDIVAARIREVLDGV